MIRLEADYYEADKYTTKPYMAIHIYDPIIAEEFVKFMRASAKESLENNIYMYAADMLVASNDIAEELPRFTKEYKEEKR